MTRPLTESVGPSLDSIVLRSTIGLNFYSAFDFNALGICRMVLTTGVKFYIISMW